MAIRIILSALTIVGIICWLYFTGKTIYNERKKEQEIVKSLSTDISLLRKELDIFKEELDTIKKNIC